MDSNTYPASLNRLGDSAPKNLYMRGNTSLLQSSTTIGIIGSRKAHLKSLNAIGAIVEATPTGGVVISGGALGADIRAHTDALRHGVPTIVVLPCGIETAYPSSHAPIFQQVLNNDGLLISEYPGNEAPRRDTFLARNRIIAALSTHLYAVDAAPNSGSASTVRWAQQLGVPVTHVNAHGSVNVYNLQEWDATNMLASL